MQEWRVIAMFNRMLLDKRINRHNNKWTYRTIFKSTIIYTSELWKNGQLKINRKQRRRQEELTFWHVDQERKNNE